MPSHWRLWERTGNGYKVTHYDALWRPVVEDTYDYGDVADTRSIVVKRYDAAGRLSFQSYPVRTLTNYAIGLWHPDQLRALGRITRVEQDSELGELLTTTEYLTDFKTRVTNPPASDHHQLHGLRPSPAPTGRSPYHPSRRRLSSIVRDLFGTHALSRRNADSSVMNGRYYAYDQHQRLGKLSEPETVTNAMGYDDAGTCCGRHPAVVVADRRLPHARGHRRAPRGPRVRRSQRLRALEFPTARQHYWSYTPDGLPDQLSTFSRWLESLNTYVYNNRRLLVGEALTVPAWYVTSRSVRLQRHRPSDQSAYPSGLTVTYSPNALGQPPR